MQAFLCILCLTLQLYWDLNSNYCPGQRAFKFTSPLNALMTLQYNEAKSMFRMKGLYSMPKPTLKSYNGNEAGS